ncbi:MAG TPA: RNA 3'-terminal phosphate cyclase [Candidatus Methylomirabilis sp.]|nr:RNA 3'-terminal phosphate cyclase [Candidatus Methylomirabilis sp.]
MLRVDGGQGEGGGQVLRTALALSAIRGLPVEVHSIRTGRRTPGLQAQHLTAVTALARICGAHVEGASLGSQRVHFTPGTVRPDEFHFNVGTAGSTALVLQAILLPLALADGSSRISLTGGTHVPWSPPADYLRDVFFPVLAGMGIAARLHVDRWGFYPKGGGRVIVEVEGGADLHPTTLVSREGNPELRGLSAVANLPRKIAERQRDRALQRLRREGCSAEIEIVEADAPDTGTFLMLVAEIAGIPAGFSALGERGKPAENVADEAVGALLDFLKAEAACDPHLADQVILPMALTPGTSRLTTSRVTRHLLTTVRLVQQLLGCPVQVGGEEGSPGTVTIEGSGIGGRGSGSRAQSPEPRAEMNPVADIGEAQTSIGHSAIRISQSAIGPEARIRKARAEDVPAIQQLVTYFAARGELLPRTLNELYQHLRDFFVYELHGEVVGIAALSLYWEDLAEVRSLAVQEGQGGKGLGAALVHACLDEAARLGIRRVFALTYRPGFFERLGFREIDKRELPQKIWKDCIRCAKFACCDEVALIRETQNVKRKT